MTITLTPEQHKWLESQVAAGHFASIEEAVSVAVADLIASHPKSEQELAYLRTLIEEGDADVAANRVHRYADAEELTADIVARGAARFTKRG